MGFSSWGRKESDASGVIEQPGVQKGLDLTL